MEKTSNKDEKKVGDYEYFHKQIKYENSMGKWFQMPQKDLLMLKISKKRSLHNQYVEYLQIIHTFQIQNQKFPVLRPIQFYQTEQFYYVIMQSYQCNLLNAFNFYYSTKNFDNTIKLISQVVDLYIQTFHEKGVFKSHNCLNYENIIFLNFNQDSNDRILFKDCWQNSLLIKDYIDFVETHNKEVQKVNSKNQIQTQNNSALKNSYQIFIAPELKSSIEQNKFQGSQQADIYSFGHFLNKLSKENHFLQNQFIQNLIKQMCEEDPQRRIQWIILQQELKNNLMNLSIIQTLYSQKSNEDLSIIEKQSQSNEFSSNFLSFQDSDTKNSSKQFSIVEQRQNQQQSKQKLSSENSLQQNSDQILFNQMQQAQNTLVYKPTIPFTGDSNTFLLQNNNHLNKQIEQQQQQIQQQKTPEQIQQQIEQIPQQQQIQQNQQFQFTQNQQFQLKQQTESLPTSNYIHNHLQNQYQQQNQFQLHHHSQSLPENSIKQFQLNQNFNNQGLNNTFQNNVQYQQPQQMEINYQILQNNPQLKETDIYNYQIQNTSNLKTMEHFKNIQIIQDSNQLQSGNKQPEQDNQQHQQDNQINQNQRTYTFNYMPQTNQPQYEVQNQDQKNTNEQNTLLYYFKNQNKYYSNVEEIKQNIKAYLKEKDLKGLFNAIVIAEQSIQYKNLALALIEFFFEFSQNFSQIQQVFDNIKLFDFFICLIQYSHATMKKSVDLAFPYQAQLVSLSIIDDLKVNLSEIEGIEKEYVQQLKDDQNELIKNKNQNEQRNTRYKISEKYDYENVVKSFIDMEQELQSLSIKQIYKNNNFFKGIFFRFNHLKELDKMIWNSDTNLTFNFEYYYQQLSQYCPDN